MEITDDDVIRTTITRKIMGNKTKTMDNKTKTIGNKIKTIVTPINSSGV